MASYTRRNLLKAVGGLTVPLSVAGCFQRSTRSTRTEPTSHRRTTIPETTSSHQTTRTRTPETTTLDTTTATQTPENNKTNAEIIQVKNAEYKINAASEPDSFATVHARFTNQAGIKQINTILRGGLTSGKVDLGRYLTTKYQENRKVAVVQGEIPNQLWQKLENQINFQVKDKEQDTQSFSHTVEMPDLGYTLDFEQNNLREWDDTEPLTDSQIEEFYWNDVKRGEESLTGASGWEELEPTIKQRYNALKTEAENDIFALVKAVYDAAQKHTNITSSAGMTTVTVPGVKKYGKELLDMDRGDMIVGRDIGTQGKKNNPDWGADGHERGIIFLNNGQRIVFDSWINQEEEIDGNIEYLENFPRVSNKNNIYSALGLDGKKLYQQAQQGSLRGVLAATYSSLSSLGMIDPVSNDIQVGGVEDDSSHATYTTKGVAEISTENIWNQTNKKKGNSKILERASKLMKGIRISDDEDFLVNYLESDGEEAIYIGPLTQEQELKTVKGNYRKGHWKEDVLLS